MAPTLKRTSKYDKNPAKRAKKEKVENIAEIEDDSQSESEDVLDNGLENGDDFIEFDEEVDEQDELPVASAGTGQGNREQRQEKKRLQKERKLQKAHGAAIEEVKQIWGKLREKQGVPAAERTKMVREIMKLVDGKWKDVVFRHDASRVVQTVFKYADKALKQEITVDLKGNYVQLAKSAYGKYLLIKMLHYGSPKVRASIIDEMHGSFRKLMGHKEGAYVIEDCFRDYATAKQRRQIMREFYGSEFALFKDAGDSKQNLSEILAENVEKKPYLLENLNKVITQAVNKGSIGFEIVHAMMLEYVRNLDRQSMARENFVDLIADDIVEMVHTNAGSQVAALTVAMATAKERKRLLKSLRQFPIKLAKDNYGNFVMMAAFLSVDDTKLCHKAFQELESNLSETILDKFARRPLLMLFAGPSNTKYFGAIQQRIKEVNEFKEQTSKKEDTARNEELIAAFMPALVNEVKQNASLLLNEPLGSQFILELLTHHSNQEIIDAVADVYESDPSDKNHILNVNPFSGRTAKELGKRLPEFRARLLAMVTQYPLQWATGEGTFAVVALLEVIGDKEAKQLKKLLSKYKKEIEKCDAKGKDVLLTLIK